MRPHAIEERLQLRNPIYLETAAYGHMGKTPRKVTKVFESPYNGKVEKEVTLFTWEQLDKVPEVQKAFDLWYKSLWVGVLTHLQYLWNKFKQLLNSYQERWRD